MKVDAVFGGPRASHNAPHSGPNNFDSLARDQAAKTCVLGFACVAVCACCWLAACPGRQKPWTAATECPALCLPLPIATWCSRPYSCFWVPPDTNTPATRQLYLCQPGRKSITIRRLDGAAQVPHESKQMPVRVHILLRIFARRPHCHAVTGQCSSAPPHRQLDQHHHPHQGMRQHLQIKPPAEPAARQHAAHAQLLTWGSPPRQQHMLTSAPRSRV